jgi:hypothetical protein
MILAIVALTMAAGATLWFGLSGRKHWLGSVRWLHRGLALMSVIAALIKGGTLIGGSVVIVGSLGFISARVKNRSLSVLLFAVHLVGAISLLILIGLARSFTAY